VRVYNVVKILTTLYTYEVCPKSKCTDFPMYELVTCTSLMYIGALVVTLAACPYLFQLDWLVESIVRYCCLCMVLFYSLVTIAM